MFQLFYSPEDTNLVREVGKALVMTHDYNRAIKYYETTLHDDPKLVREKNFYKFFSWT